MDFITITPLINNLGFPIVMCFYFVIRFEKILKKNTEALQELKITIKSKR